MRVRAMAEIISAGQHGTEIVECYVSRTGCSRADWKVNGLGRGEAYLRRRIVLPLTVDTMRKSTRSPRFPRHRSTGPTVRGGHKRGGVGRRSRPLLNWRQVPHCKLEFGVGREPDGAAEARGSGGTSGWLRLLGLLGLGLRCGLGDRRQCAAAGRGRR